MNLAHGATILHGDDIATFAVACVVALAVVAGVWLSSRRKRRASEVDR